MNSPTPQSSAAPINGRKNIQLTTTQGLLMVAVLILFFGAIFYWIANMYPRSFTGIVKTSAGNFAPLGCHSDGPRLTVPLRPDPQPEGFRDENRALIFTHNITERSTNSAIPAEVTAVAWRDQEKNISQITCSKLDDAFTVFRKRRGGRRVIRDDYWNGTVQATCDVPGVGSVEVDLDVENCGA